MASTLTPPGARRAVRGARTVPWREAFSVIVVGWLAVWPGRAVEAQEPPLDVPALGWGPFATMTTLLEKTIFKVDVLTLDLHFGPETAARLEDLASGRQLSADLADSIAMVGATSQNAWAKMHFERNVSFGQFIGAIRKNAQRARDDGIILGETFDFVDTNLPVWYGFLRERGVRDGDEMIYRIQGDTLRTVFRTVDGEIPLDQVDVGSERRLSVLGGFFAKGSDFRRGLIASLFDRKDS